MRIKKVLKGLAVAAFTTATVGIGTALIINESLKKNDIKIDTSQTDQAPINFHGIPVQDVMIATYASYFSGTDKQGNFDLGSRAENTFGMNDALLENFTGDNAPWIMLDSLSDGRNNSNASEDMQGAHLVAMYHKGTQQVVITMPGMEYDYSLTDTLDDAKQLISGSVEQTQALQRYAEHITSKIKNNEFIDGDGVPLEIASDKPIIASHSLGSKPTHVMSITGYQTIMMEPRPLTDIYILTI